MSDKYFIQIVVTNILYNDAERLRLGWRAPVILVDNFMKRDKSSDSFIRNKLK
jgi:hypothetical protein